MTSPDLAHAIDATGATVLMLFIDPACDAGGRLTRALANAPRWFDEDARDHLVDRLPPEPTGAELTAWIPATLESLGVTTATPPRAIHPRVKKVLTLLADAPLDPAPSLATYAERVGLSASRLMHVFTTSTGTTWRAYLRWLRLQRAAAAMARGLPLTEAALAAGFHDAAHMTRTFKEMYGLTPSQLRPPSAAP